MVALEQRGALFSGREPELIQGGMGVGVSSWRLAKAVAEAGKKLDKNVLGVVSGTGLPIVMVDRLEHGDVDTIRALRAFPVPEIAQEILDMYPLGSKKLPPKPQVLLSGSTQKTETLMANLLVVSNFVEVWLAKEGHDKDVGTNLLEKIQLTHLHEIYGAMLAGVDYVLMGAGIPNQVPEVLNKLARNQPAEYKIDVEGLPGRYKMSFDPSTLIPENLQRELKRPKFLAIVSSHALAQRLARIPGIDGFVVEGPIAGGHNAPARGKEQNELGEPVYGERDEPDLGKIKELGFPFWLAGGYAGPEGLRKAKEYGAAGVQVGSAFALCNESGWRETLKSELRQMIFDGTLKVITDPNASPSGFPFQVVQVPGTLSDPGVYSERERVCPYGFLTTPFTEDENEENIDFRCPAEPIDVYVRKGGQKKETEGKQCLCSGLVAAVGHAGEGKPMIVTLGKDLRFAKELMNDPKSTWSAEAVVEHICGK